MSNENPLWGAPRIHGDLLMLGIEVAQSTVARCMTRRQGPPSQGWKTFLRNHAAGIASVDLFVVRIMSFSRRMRRSLGRCVPTQGVVRQIGAVGHIMFRVPGTIPHVNRD
jgi:hypothetical protein